MMSYPHLYRFNDANTCFIDGSRIVRKFNKVDPVRYIFEFVKAEVAEAETRPFEVCIPPSPDYPSVFTHTHTDARSPLLQLVYNRQQLIDLIDKDIKEAGLENSAINFIFS